MAISEATRNMITRHVTEMLSPEEREMPENKTGVEKLVGEIERMVEKHNCAPGDATLAVTDIEFDGKRNFKAAQALLSVIPQAMLQMLFKSRRDCLKGLIVFGLMELLMAQPDSLGEVRVYLDALLTRVENGLTKLSETETKPEAVAS